MSLFTNHFKSPNDLPPEVTHSNLLRAIQETPYGRTRKEKSPANSTLNFLLHSKPVLSIVLFLTNITAKIPSPLFQPLSIKNNRTQKSAHQIYNFRWLKEERCSFLTVSITSTKPHSNSR